MFFADATALTAVGLMPKPIFSIMGGIRHTESEDMILGAALAVMFFGAISAPIWFVGALIAFVRKGVWGVPAGVAKGGPSGRGLWVLAIASLVVWLPVLPWTQAEQALRLRAERALEAGRIDEALQLMSEHDQSDFPPQWDPPPRVGYGENIPPIDDVMDVVVTRDTPGWVRKCFLDKFQNYNGQKYELFYQADWPKRLARFVRILEQVPEGPEIAAEYRSAAENHLAGRALPPEEREPLISLLKLAERNEAGPKR
jgi:hypothetical protein